MSRPCSIKGCERPYSYSGLCGAHAERARTGRPVDGPIRRYRVDIVTLVEKTDTCWNWVGPIRADGYGSYTGGQAHRLMYQRLVGPIPEGLQIDHLCRNRRCVNPEHLEAVTQRENILRSEAPNAVAVRTNRCLRGHAFTPENTLTRPDGSRYCRPCARERARKSAA